MIPTWGSRKRGTLRESLARENGTEPGRGRTGLEGTVAPIFVWDSSSHKPRPRTSNRTRERKALAKAEGNEPANANPVPIAPMLAVAANRRQPPMFCNS